MSPTGFYENNMPNLKYFEIYLQHPLQEIVFSGICVGASNTGVVVVLPTL